MRCATDNPLGGATHLTLQVILPVDDLVAMQEVQGENDARGIKPVKRQRISHTITMQ